MKILVNQICERCDGGKKKSIVSLHDGKCKMCGGPGVIGVIFEFDSFVELIFKRAAELAAKKETDVQGD